MSRHKLFLSPTAPSTFMLMAALAEMPANPYSLILRVQGMTSGAVALGKSTVYAALATLERDGLISSLEDPTRKGSRVFELTPQGRRALKQTANLYADVARQTLGKL